LDVPTPPTIVLVRPAPCADANKAEELLRRSLAPALAPRGSWSVILRFSQKGGALSVEGEITDEVDASVAHRVLTEPGFECSSLARAVGVWAALVLDAEVERAARAPPPPPPPPPAVAPPVLPQVTEKLAPESGLLLAHPEGERTVELGASMFLMGGTGAGMIAGPSLFAVAEAGRGWFLRPSIFVGRTLEELGVDVYATWVAARLDACGRIAGFYIEHHGIQLDVCGGLEIGFQHFDSASSFTSATGPADSHTQPFVALGPSVALRGELGSGLALLLRGVGDFNIPTTGTFSVDGTMNGTVTPGYFVGRAELGLSWQLR
jgi:hypothetical protein